MYSFAQRSDTRALDEPLYGHYLRTTGAQHPGRDQVLASMETDGQKVVQEVILGPCDRPVLFMKQMVHHLIGLDLSFLRQTVNVLLVRDPVLVIASLARKLSAIEMRDTGFAGLSELRQQLRAWGQDPPVLDSGYLLQDPRGVLNALCDSIGIAFDPAMLRWEAGNHPENGVWAPYWYEKVELSTGFQPFEEPAGQFPERFFPLLQECRPHYERLKADAIRTVAVTHG
jgi:hypothetical protein